MNNNRIAENKICGSFPKKLKAAAAGGICAALLMWGMAGAVTYAVNSPSEESGVVTLSLIHI